MTEEMRGMLRFTAAAAELLGDDVDGLAALVEDLKALD